ncbi:hypothetical protein HELRODRAFT_194326 [Helobdella robusta]|uniref:SANT domain-containing protein n=1 Tax=Helobdella robusta TaxID=6412 RepID=T1FVX8_HELRO|nr:hypothetical protein HELRODRAFT_194326 [Helobdella robusta]ESN92173.1 hypothetical protein HELRODRAFT_194326 [Helobdella robusta]
MNLEGQSEADDQLMLECKRAVVKRRESWKVNDINSFFEALFEHGKDFDAIQLTMANKSRRTTKERRNVKSKEQIRHFYYRTWHKISQYINLNNVDDVDVTSAFISYPESRKQNMELKAVLCYGEIRKKVKISFDEKFGQKLNELFCNGSTMIRMRGRRCLVKVPCCPAFKKINNQTVDPCLKLPDEISVELLPRRNDSWLYVQLLSHNPRIRVSVGLDQVLLCLINCLQDKWKHPLGTKVLIYFDNDYIYNSQVSNNNHINNNITNNNNLDTNSSSRLETSGTAAGGAGLATSTNLDTADTNVENFSELLNEVLGDNDGEKRGREKVMAGKRKKLSDDEDEDEDDSDDGELDNIEEEEEDDDDDNERNDRFNNEDARVGATDKCNEGEHRAGGYRTADDDDDDGDDEDEEEENGDDDGDDDDDSNENDAGNVEDGDNVEAVDEEGDDNRNGNEKTDEKEDEEDENGSDEDNHFEDVDDDDDEDGLKMRMKMMYLRGADEELSGKISFRDLYTFLSCPNVIQLRYACLHNYQYERWKSNNINNINNNINNINNNININNINNNINNNNINKDVDNHDNNVDNDGMNFEDRSKNFEMMSSRLRTLCEVAMREFLPLFNIPKSKDEQLKTTQRLDDSKLLTAVENVSATLSSPTTPTSTALTSTPSTTSPSPTLFDVMAGSCNKNRATAESFVMPTSSSSSSSSFSFRIPQSLPARHHAQHQQQASLHSHLKLSQQVSTQQQQDTTSQQTAQPRNADKKIVDASSLMKLPIFQRKNESFLSRRTRRRPAHHSNNAPPTQRTLLPKTESELADWLASSVIIINTITPSSLSSLSAPSTVATPLSSSSMTSSSKLITMDPAELKPSFRRIVPITLNVSSASSSSSSSPSVNSATTTTTTTAIISSLPTASTPQYGTETSFRVITGSDVFLNVHEDSMSNDVATAAAAAAASNNHISSEESLLTATSHGKPVICDLWRNADLSKNFSVSLAFGKMTSSTAQHQQHQHLFLSELSRESSHSKLDVDSTFQCLLNESSLDYAAKFADIAAMLSSSSSSSPHHPPAQPPSTSSSWLPPQEILTSSSSSLSSSSSFKI